MFSQCIVPVQDRSVSIPPFDFFAKSPVKVTPSEKIEVSEDTPKVEAIETPDAPVKEENVVTMTIGEVAEKICKISLDQMIQVVESLPKDNICLFYLLKYSVNEFVREVARRELEKRKKKDDKYLIDWMRVCLNLQDEIIDGINRVPLATSIMMDNELYGKELRRDHKKFAKTVERKFEELKASENLEKTGCVDFFKNIRLEISQTEEKSVNRRLFDDDEDLQVENESLMREVIRKTEVIIDLQKEIQKLEDIAEKKTGVIDRKNKEIEELQQALEKRDEKNSDSKN